MEQGIQTIEAATTVLESATEFLDQATAVATEALSTVKMPDKLWFAEQEGVAAVVSNWAELKAALDSGKSGNIVIYGNIECQDTINLKAGQNLVGVGYYGVEDSTIDKFSQLSMDLNAYGLTDGIKVQGDNSLVADLTIKAKTNNEKNSQVINLKGTKNHMLHNLDILMDTKEQNPYATGVAMASSAIYEGEFTLTGINNINDVTDSSKSILNYAINYSDIRLEGELNINLASRIARGIAYGTIETVAQAKLNILRAYRAVESTTSIFGDNSKINISSNGDGAIVYGGFTIKDSAMVNINCSKGSAFLAAKSGSTDFSLAVNLESVSAVLNITGSRLYNNNNQLLEFKAAEGSKINYNGKVYVAEKEVDDNMMNYNTMPEGFVEVAGESAPTMPSFDWLSTQNTNRNMGYYKDNDSYTKQYRQIITEYDKLIKDSSYQGINLLKGSKLELTLNESRSNKFVVWGRDMSSVKLGLITHDWQGQDDIKASIDEIKTAITTLRSLAEELGNQYSVIQTRINFTEGLSDILQTGADDLTLADMNEASAQYLSLQTRQQLAINSLSLAAQSASSVLSLF